MNALVSEFNQDKSEDDAETSEWAEALIVFRPGGESIEEGRALAYIPIRGERTIRSTA